MARLPPPREAYRDTQPKKIFNALEGKTVPDGRLSFAEICVAMKPVSWHQCGLDDGAMGELLAREVQTNGDQLMSWEEFWNFCLKNGTGHPPDPAEIAKEYLLKHRVLSLFEMMTAALLYYKPEDPKQFLVDRLVKLKCGNGEPFFLDNDLKTMFSMFDITGRGTITIDQCNAAMATLMGPGKDAKDALGPEKALLTCDEFISVMKEALSSVAPA
mmetsp:Transcript_39188/g.85253  ORF Transcript_39188/g.85253 Transcript_39188/m.85253 type:complete len:215 (-) Transcript_39188:393-1037(-)|eukprot:CAMPEP_0118935610 /NCGR_PEP_ID=MMETSP1169-20130426/15737_1 /TAXON_ID=36882 /ORGANISM="Pyramimonas obovata, Strain CCMP722" /LENGTH=214 /DNA_ID=CAMNT_0006878667 /DNA_START=135 /DNA_END=779 /DNA_ORIENTATION=-